MEYPTWICTECAMAAGKIWPTGHLATWHDGVCDVCGKLKSVTEPRDWKHFNDVELKKLEEIRDANQN